MCVGLFECVNVFVCMRVCLCACQRVYVRVRVYICESLRLCVCVRVYVQVNVMCVCACLFVNACVCGCVGVCVCVYAREPTQHPVPRARGSLITSCCSAETHRQPGSCGNRGRNWFRGPGLYIFLGEYSLPIGWLLGRK